MFVDEIWDFKSLNMGRELEIAVNLFMIQQKRLCPSAD